MNLQTFVDLPQIAATLMSTTFEAMGVLVHRRIAPLPLVQDLVGGFAVVTQHRSWAP
jgi:hypothetical protein